MARIHAAEAEELRAQAYDAARRIDAMTEAAETLGDAELLPPESVIATSDELRTYADNLSAVLARSEEGGAAA
jgi:hypothetical protein